MEEQAKLTRVQGVLEEHKDLLNAFEAARVFSICASLESDMVEVDVIEMCDEWFGKELTKTNCLELSELFAELAECL